MLKIIKKCFNSFDILNPQVIIIHRLNDPNLMKFKFFFAFVFSFLACHFSKAQTFQLKQGIGLATDIAINPNDGNLYIVGVSKNVLKYDQTKKSIKSYGPKSNNVKEIDFSNNGQVFMLSTGKQLHQLKNNQWKKLGSGKYNSFCVDSKNHPWVVTSSKKLTQYYLGTWKSIPSLPARNVTKVVAYSDNLCYVIKSDKSISMFSNGTWVKLPGKVVDIAFDKKNNEVYSIQHPNRVFKFNRQSRKWVALKGGYGNFTKIAVHDGEIWAVNKNKKILHYNPSTAIVSPPPKAKILNNTSLSTRTTSNSSMSKMSSNSSSTSRIPANNSSRNNRTNNNSSTATSQKKNYAGTYRFMLTKILTFSPEQSAINKSIDIYGTMGIYVTSKNSVDNVKLTPLNNQRNRMLDIPKGNTVEIKPIHHKNPKKVKVLEDDGNSNFYTYYGEYEVDRIREFKVSSAFANNQIIFDLQTNMTQKLLAGELNFGWKRRMINIDDIELGKEIFMKVRAGSYPGSYLYIGYKITKQ